MRGWVFFDLNGTLLDPATVGRAAGDERLGVRALDLAVSQAMSDTLTGEFRAFPDYLEAALGRLLAAEGRDPAALDDAMEAAKRMQPFPDAAAALGRVRDAGARTMVLTNSAAAAAAAALDAGGLRELVDVVVGADEVGAYKPDARVYRHGLERAGAEAAGTWLVAAHAWDVLGAKRAGLRTGWVGREEGALLETVPEPDVTGPDLTTVCEAIAQRV